MFISYPLIFNTIQQVQTSTYRNSIRLISSTLKAGVGHNWSSALSVDNHSKERGLLVTTTIHTPGNPNHILVVVIFIVVENHDKVLALFGARAPIHRGSCDRKKCGQQEMRSSNLIQTATLNPRLISISGAGAWESLQAQLGGILILVCNGDVGQRWRPVLLFCGQIEFRVFGARFEKRNSEGLYTLEKKDGNMFRKYLANHE